ncbi:hypothetical protein FRC19_011486 [Serendipita sp. 401]|nr:hypothetical protein FRC19_011486 [Serendipita sp. 401]
MELPQSRYQTRPQSRQGALKKPNNYNFQQEWKIFRKPCLPPTFNGLVSAQTDVSSLSPSPHPLVLQDTGATMSSNPRRQSHNGSQQQASTSNTQYGYQVQPGDYSPNASQGSFPQEGVYNYQSPPPESFGTYPPGQAYPQGVYPGHVQSESMQQHLGAYSSQVLPQHYPADPNAPGWAYGARPPQGVPANVVYQPQGGPYRPFTPQPHLQQQWVDMEGLRASTPQPGMSGYPLLSSNSSRLVERFFHPLLPVSVPIVQHHLKGIRT